MTDFEALSACIRSGQIPEHLVPQIMRDNPEFAEWYLNAYPASSV